MRNLFYFLFVPHPSNNHRAKVIHYKSLLALILFFTFSSFFFSSTFNPFSNKIRAFADISLKELLDNTNQDRVENGLPKLLENSQLDLAAQRKADDMFAKNYWAHNSPDGTTPWSFITGTGYNYVYAGENLARGFNSAKEVVNAWMASPEHRANILSPNYRDVGFAVEHGNLSGEDTFLVVQEFGNKSIIPPASPIPDSGIRKVLGFSLSPKIEPVKSLSFSSIITITLVIALIATFATDLFVIRKKYIPRIVGHSLDHLLFMISLMFVLILIGIGQIV